MRLPFSRPSLRPYLHLIPPASNGTGLTARFLGTGSLLLSDANGAVLADGFVTRPGMARVLFGRVAPDEDAVRAAQERAGLQSLDAVFCTHSHYDHALDAPAWARRTGALLIGSESTANVGRGYGLPERSIRVVQSAQPMTAGPFTLTFRESEHSHPDRYPGTIDAPLVPPARARAYRSASIYSVHVAHPRGNLLVHASAGHRPGMLRGLTADVAYLGLTNLGRQPQHVFDAYWNEVVRTTAARRVIVIHWDDFFRRIDRPPRPLPYLMDDLEGSMGRLLARAAAEGVDVQLPVPWRPTDPFADLPNRNPGPATH